MAVISMSPLTGAIAGSNRADEITGAIALTDPTWNSIIAGIVDATVNSVEGSDEIAGTTTLLSQSPATSDTDSITAIGIRNSAIDAGQGEDAIVGVGSITGEFSYVPGLTGNFYSYGGDGLTAVNGGNGTDWLTFDGNTAISITNHNAPDDLFPFRVYANAESYGVRNSNLYGDAGVDILTITSSSNINIDIGVYRHGVCRANSYAALDSTINGDSGSDVITLTSMATVTANAAGNYYGPYGIGIMRTSVMGGDGNDVITVSGTSIARIIAGRSASYTRMYAFGVVGWESMIDGGNGNDTISVAGTASVQMSSSVGGFPLTRGYGMSGGTINGGDGNDTITIEGTGVNEGYGANGSIINGGTGDDIIEIAGNGGNSGYGVVFGTVDSGTGDDIIEITGNSDYLGCGVTTGTVDGGDGDDIIEIIATGRRGIGVGNYYDTGSNNAVINGGNGADYIEISGVGSDGGVGVTNSTVDGGVGNDTIIVRGSTDAIREAIIRGGDGNDDIDVGIGSGTIDGGNGRDRINLDFFDPATMTIAPNGAGGIRLFSDINDTFTNQPLWSQDILNVERFQIGGEIYNTNRLLRTFGNV